MPRKLKRVVSVLLAVLLLCALPAAGFAEEEVPAFTGTVLIVGGAVFGNVLTAEIDVNGPYMLQWMRDGAKIEGAVDATYEIVAEDLGREITLAVCAMDDENAVLQSEVIVPEKATPEETLPPQAQSVTADSIVLAAVAGYEYRVSDGNWQDEPVFLGLAPNREHVFYQRSKESVTHTAGVESEALALMTHKRLLAGDLTIEKDVLYPAAVLQADISGVLPAEAEYGFEWRIDGAIVGREGSYVLRAEDMGKNIALWVRGTGDFAGTLMSEELPLVFERIASSKYLVVGDTYLKGIAAGTNVKQLRAATKNGDTLRVSDHGKVLGEQAAVPSGALIELVLDGVVRESLFAVVMGDVDGDAMLSAGDARLVLRASAGLERFEEIQILAADVKGTGITAITARTLLRASAGLEKL